MLRNYFIAAIRAIRRSPWEAILKIFAIAAGVCTSVLHIAYWYSGDFSNFPELFTGLFLLAMTSVLLIQFYGRPQDNREYRLRLILGDEDLLMRGRKIAEAGLIILGGVILGLVCADAYIAYVDTQVYLGKIEYISGILILGFLHFTIFLFTVWFGSAIVIRNNSDNFSRFCKLLAGTFIFFTSVFAIIWSIGSDKILVFASIYFVDIIAMSFFSFSSWNRLAQYILESKSRALSIMKLQGAPEIKLLIYWFLQLGPAALISVGLSLLVGNIFLFLEMPRSNEIVTALFTLCWAFFVLVIIGLGLSQPVLRGFKGEAPRSIP